MSDTLVIIVIIVISVVPSLIVALTAFFLAKHYVENDQKKRLLELKFHSKELVTPIRLQAYERMAMFLERIDPNQLLFRVSNPELTAYQMQTILLATIRSEYEHNLSQEGGCAVRSRRFDSSQRSRRERKGRDYCTVSFWASL